MLALIASVALGANVSLADTNATAWANATNRTQVFFPVTCPGSDVVCDPHNCVDDIAECCPDGSVCPGSTCSKCQCPKCPFSDKEGKSSVPLPPPLPKCPGVDVPCQPDLCLNDIAMCCPDGSVCPNSTCSKCNCPNCNMADGSGGFKSIPRIDGLAKCLFSDATCNPNVCEGDAAQCCPDGYACPGHTCDKCYCEHCNTTGHEGAKPDHFVTPEEAIERVAAAAREAQKRIEQEHRELERATQAIHDITSSADSPAAQWGSPPPQSDEPEPEPEPEPESEPEPEPESEADTPAEPDTPTESDKPVSQPEPAQHPEPATSPSKPADEPSAQSGGMSTWDDMAKRLQTWGEEHGAFPTPKQSPPSSDDQPGASVAALPALRAHAEAPVATPRSHLFAAYFAGIATVFVAFGVATATNMGLRRIAARGSRRDAGFRRGAGAQDDYVGLETAILGGNAGTQRQ